MSIESVGWDKERIENLLSNEQFLSQKIGLPFGFVTDGEDRSRAWKIVHKTVNFRGKSVLDVSCSLGYFCLEALKSGARRSVGWDADPENVRLAKILASILNLPAEYYEKDIENEDISETYDIVLCLNVLRRVRDPIALLYKLACLTREVLVLEVTGLNYLDSKRMGLPLWKSRLISNLPIILVSHATESPSLLTHQEFLVTSKAIANLLSMHMYHFSKVEVFKSRFEEWTLAVAYKRRIKHLVIVAGPTSSGKSTFVEKLVNDSFPAINNALGVSSFRDWACVSASKIHGLQQPYLEGLVLHYDFLRPHGRSARVFSRDIALDLIKCAERVSVITIWASPDRLRYQLRKAKFENRVATSGTRILGKLVGYLPESWLKKIKHFRIIGSKGGTAFKLPSSRHLALLAEYKDPSKVAMHYNRWLDFCDSNISNLWLSVVVEMHAEGVRILPYDKWKRKAVTCSGGKLKSSRVFSG